MPIVAAGITGAATVFGAHQSKKASDRAVDAQTQAANQAAALEAQSAREALDFAKQQEAERQKEFYQTQQQNYGLYLQKRGDLAPYRNLGAASVGQLAQPLPNWQKAGSLGERMGG